MPNHKSCVKRVKTSDAARIRNRAIGTTLRASIREFRELTSKTEAAARLQTVTSIIAKAASRGLIHKGNADRLKSRLAKYVQKLSA